MAIFRQPGVYFTENIQSVGSTAFGFNRTAVIGLGQTYTNISNLELVKSNSSAEESGDILAESGDSNFDYILLPNGATATPSDILSVDGLGNIPGYFNYIADIDYTISELDDKAVIIWLGDNKPVANSTFYISYKLNKSELRGDFDPKLLFNQSAIRETYGPEYLNGVIQPLTLAADLVLEGQTLLGGGVYCVQVTSDTEAAYKAAIDKLMKINVQTVIILKQDSLSLRNYLIQSIETCSSDLYGKERTTFIVPDSVELPVETMVAQREGLKNTRVTYFCNKLCTVNLTDEITQESENVVLNAIYACCNLSGIEGNPDYTYSEPMLRKKLSSRITLVGDQILDPSERNYYCSNFLSAFDFDENTNLVNVFDIYTTDDTNIVTETRAVRRVTDLLRADLRKQLATYIGQKTSGATASSAQVRTQSILQNYVIAEEIKDYQNVKSSFDKNNPKQLNISFDYIPLFETKYVHVTLNINI